MSEFCRMVDLRELGNAPHELAATPEECAALAERFALVAISKLEATITLEPEGAAVRASGRLGADVVQSCAVSGEDLPVTIDEPVSFRFVPERAAGAPDEEIELDADALDEIEFSGPSFDLGEALAQSLVLALDPFAVGPGAEEARRKAGIVAPSAAGPFAALAALKQQD